MTSDEILCPMWPAPEPPRGVQPDAVSTLST